MTKKKKALIFILVIALIGIFAYASASGSKGELKELTEEEKIEDFRYMYDIMKDNYPHFHSIEKMYGYDWLANKEEFEKEIRETKDNMEFFYAMNDILVKTNDGHTGLLKPLDYEYMLQVINRCELTDEILGPYEKMFKKVRNKYKGWDETFTEKYFEDYTNVKEYMKENIHSRDTVDTQILEKHKQIGRAHV